MTNGELGSQPDPVRELEFDGPSLTAVLGSELSAVQDAQGDLKGAKVRMAEQVEESQRDVRAVEDRLTGRQQAVIARTEKLRLVGRAINFEEGTSAGEIRAAGRGKSKRTYELPRRKNLAGVKGVVVGSDVGPGPDKESTSDSLLLHVAVSGRLIPPRAFRRYIVRVDEAVFSMGKAPEHADY